MVASRLVKTISCQKHKSLNAALPVYKIIKEHFHQMIQSINTLSILAILQPNSAKINAYINVLTLTMIYLLAIAHVVRVQNKAIWN